VNWRVVAASRGSQNARWFGQVTDLIDAACALAGVPSFALVRVREASGNVNDAAWRKEYSHLRDRIIAMALAGVWTDEDFGSLTSADVPLIEAEKLSEQAGPPHRISDISMPLAFRAVWSPVVR
jgi:hypothetical protein